MPRLESNLIIDRCPHCSVANPNLFKRHYLSTQDHVGHFERHWFVYSCGSCGGVVTAWASSPGSEVVQIFPEPQTVDADIPDRPKSFLEQAIASIHAPAGAVMLAASSVDSMLKIKGYTQGNLYNRIEKAAEDHLITAEMAAWAHDVRLDANDQRHADEESSLPTQDDAQRAIDFTKALAEFLFVLPAKVRRGRESH
ncbi:MAG: DUF4145 domain-containing protein [Hydrogenophilaceae bacterium]|nr:DUF4145 domain-containing protein [Hydrogenophilaceae bacterium]